MPGGYNNFSNIDTGFDLVDTPNPNEVGVAVTVPLINTTQAMLPVRGEKLGACRMPVQNPGLTTVWQDYEFSHGRRMGVGTRTLFYYAPKTDATVRQPFASDTRKEHCDFYPILKGFLVYKDPGAPYILMSSTSLDAGQSRDRYGVKRLYHPSFSGPCEVTYHYYLSNDPFPRDMVDADDPPVPSEVNVPLALGLNLEFDKCLHGRLDFYQLDLGNLVEVGKVGEWRDSFMNLSTQVCPATNHTTWQDYVLDFSVSRTDGEQGQYFGVERVVSAPPLPNLIFD